jgi:pyruvate ferredoxin oxidoreductase gamma subunit
MLAAVVKVSGVMDEQKFLDEMEASYKHKFAHKPEVIEGNMNALKMTLAEVN